MARIRGLDLCIEICSREYGSVALGVYQEAERRKADEQGQRLYAVAIPLGNKIQ